MILRVASLIGTARPRPTPATAVFTPTTRPALSTSAPPELPGLSEASVWIRLSITRTAWPERAGSERPRADTTPAVTEPAKPLGLPIATTSWPTRSSSASPRWAAVEVGRLGAQHGEVRQRVAAHHLEAEVAAVGELRAAAAAARPATTWAEVSRKPSGVSTTPEPAPTGMLTRAGAAGHAQVGHRRSNALGHVTTVRE